eukprot:6455602-Amphidinium_carterae.1
MSSRSRCGWLDFLRTSALVTSSKMSHCVYVGGGGGGLFVQHLLNGGSGTGMGFTLQGVVLFAAGLGCMMNLRCRFLGDALIGMVNDGISSAPLDWPPGGTVCGTSTSLNMPPC